MKRWPAVLVVVGTLAAALAATVALAAPPGTNTLVSRPGGFGPLATPATNHSSTSTGAIDQLSGGSARTVSDDDGQRYVAFVSTADGLSDADDDRFSNVYVRDRTLNTTTLVSRADGPGGAGANGDSTEPSISATGRFVAFTSRATNLDPGVSGDVSHIYVRDILSGSTRLVDREPGADGAVANSGSSNPSLTVVGGNPVVAFASGADNLDGDGGLAVQVFVRNAQGDTTEMVSISDDDLPDPPVPGSGSSLHPSISTNGNHVAFESEASNLSQNMDTNNETDVYVRRLASDDTDAVSISGGAFGNGDSTEPSISADGNEVAFTSRATNLVGVVDDDALEDVYVRLFAPNTLAVASQPTGNNPDSSANSAASEPAITDSGQAVVFASAADNLTAGDTNARKDVFLRSGVFAIEPSTSRVSDPTTGAQADGHSSAPSISRTPTANGNHLVAFQTTADNMGPDDEDDFQQVYVRRAGGILLPPVAVSYISRPTGTDAFRSGVNFSALRPQVRSTEGTVSMSQDGRYTVFLSAEDDLSADDDNRFVNIFRRDNLTGETVLVSRADGPAGAPANDNSATTGGGLVVGPGQPEGAPAISADGSRIAFPSSASNLVADDSNALPDVFVRDVTAGTTVMASRQANGAPIPTPSADPAISGDGNRVAFVTGFAGDPLDVNGDPDVYMRDLTAGSTVLVSRKGAAGPPGNGASVNPAVDLDGSHVAFDTAVNDLDAANVTDGNNDSDVALHQVGQGTRYVSVTVANNGANTGNEGSGNAAISADGNRVAFASAATNVGVGLDVNGTGRDIFVREMAAGTATLVSRTAGENGISGNGLAQRASISADGTRIAFESSATDLAPGDANGTSDIFVRDTTNETIDLVSRAGDGSQSTDFSETPSISGDGSCIAFETFSDDLVSIPPGTDHLRVVARALRGDCPFGPIALGGDTDPPVISKVSLKPKRFLAGKKVRKKTKKRPAVGARLRFTLSEDARVSIRIDAKLKGKRVKKRCVKPKPRLRKRRRCTRFVRRGTLSARGKAGRNRVNFTGRVKRKRLKRGPYRLTLVATDAAGNASKPRRVSFKVLKKKKRTRRR